MGRRPNIQMHISILKEISEGEYPSNIARHLKTTKQNINYYLRYFQDSGYIELDVSDVADFYRITQCGIDYLGKIMIGQIETSKSKVKEKSHTMRETFTRSKIKKEGMPEFDNLHNIQFREIGRAHV